MNDCLWAAIGVCNERCHCDQYLTMNSDPGYDMGQEWEEKVEKVLKPLAMEFAVEHGFKEVKK